MVRNFAFWGVPCAFLVAVLSLGYGGDYHIYDSALAGYAGADGHYFYYPYYFLLIVAPFAILPHVLGYALWTLCNTLGLVYAYRTFTINRSWVFCTLQFALGLYLGQVVGLMALGMALVYRYHKTRPWWAGMGIAFLLVKPHLGIPLVLLFLIHTRWRDIPKLLTPIAVLGVVSLMIWGWWFPVVITRIQQTPPGYINPLWQILGVGVGILWLPILALPTLRERLQFALLCLFLTMPYARPYDTTLFCLFYGIEPLFGNLQLLGGGQTFTLVMAGMLYTGQIFRIVQVGGLARRIYRYP